MALNLRSTVALGLVGISSAFSAPFVQRDSLAFAGPALPLSASHNQALASRHPPALRQSRAGDLRMAVDIDLVQAGAAAAAGLGVAVGGIYFIENKAKGQDEEAMIDKMGKMGIAMEGAEAENKFSGSDQTLDDLISAMEEAQGIKEDKPKEKVAAKPKEDDDDGW